MTWFRTLISIFVQTLFWLFALITLVSGRLQGYETGSLFLILGGGIALTFVGGVWLDRLRSSFSKSKWASRLIFLVFLILALFCGPRLGSDPHPAWMSISLGILLFLIVAGRLEKRNHCTNGIPALIAGLIIWLGIRYQGIELFLEWLTLLWIATVLVIFERASIVRRKTDAESTVSPKPSLSLGLQARLLGFGIVSSAWPVLAWLALRPVMESSFSAILLLFIAWAAGSALGYSSRSWLFGSDDQSQNSSRPLAFWYAASPLFLMAFLAFIYSNASLESIGGFSLDTLRLAGAMLLMAYGGLFASLYNLPKTLHETPPGNPSILHRSASALGIAMGFSIAALFENALLPGFLLVAALAVLLPLGKPWNASKIVHFTIHSAIIVLAGLYAEVDGYPSSENTDTFSSQQERFAACLPFVLTRDADHTLLVDRVESDALPAAVTCGDGDISFVLHKNHVTSQNNENTLTALQALAAENHVNVEGFSIMEQASTRSADPYDMVVVLPRLTPEAVADFRLSPLLSSYPPNQWPGLYWLWLPLQQLSPPFFFDVVDHACQTFNNKVALVWVGDDPDSPLVALVGGNLERLRETLKFPEDFQEEIQSTVASVLPFEKNSEVTGLASLCASREKDEKARNENEFLLQLERLSSKKITSKVNTPTFLMWLLALTEGYSHTNDTAQRHWESTRSYIEGRILQAGGQRLQAIERFASSLEQKPQDNPSLKALLEAGKSAEMRKNYKEAKQFYQTILDAGVDDFEALIAVGNLSYWDHDASTAVERFQKAVILEPESPEALRGLGLALYLAGDETEAIQALLQAARLNPAYGLKNLELLARKMEKENRPEDAKALRADMADIAPPPYQ